MRSQAFFLLLLMGLVSGFNCSPAEAQIYGDRPAAQSHRQSQRQGREQKATLGTVPGIYYDPSGQLSPSLRQMEGAAESGTISFPSNSPTNYNMQRAWKRGATPDQIVKVGDLKNNPTLSRIIDINRLTLRKIAANGGADVERIPLKSVGLLNNMTVAEFFETFPNLRNASIKDVPILAQTAYAVYNASKNPQQVKQVALTVAEQQALGKLAKIDPRLGQIPLGDMVNGDWDSALAKAQTVAVQELVKKYPVLENVPISQVLNGDWKGAALTAAEQQVFGRLAEVDPRLGQLPLGDIINGDWDSALAKAQTVAVQELVKKYPVLENIPISQVLNGDWKGAALSSAEQVLISKLAGNPVFENIPLSELANGDWKGAISQVGQQQLQNLIAKHPELANLPVDKLFPMLDGAIAGDWESVARQAGEFALQKGLDLASKELLKAYPQLAQTPLGALPIDNLTVGDITGLADKPLATISKIGNRYLSELGNFSQTPGTMLAVDSAMILLTGDVFGRLDISYAGPIETPVTHVLTGGTRNQVFLPEPCTETSCKHFEISDVLSGFGGVGNVQGKAWVEGKSQSVPGGKGFLRVVNGGKERTGVPVWSTDAHVKLSLEDIDEGGNGKPATAQVWMNFQVCVYPPFMGEHCTPHFISMPTPWKVQEGGLMLVFSRASVPDFIQDARERATSQYQGQYEGSDDDSLDGSAANFGPCTNAIIQAAPSSMRRYASKSVPLLLSEAQKAGLTPAQTAYMLGTVQHESYLGQLMYEQGRGQGKKYGHWYGRGYVQLTWESNYRYWSKRLGVDFISHPELATRPDLAAKITVLGMKEGRFTGVGLNKYINGSKVNFHNARRIVNDNDRNALIASYAQHYYKVMQSCSRNASVAQSGPLNQRISQAANQSYGMSSRSGPGGGNVACAWAVNKVLNKAGIQTIGSNPNLVFSVRDALESGRGRQITNRSQAEAGDLVLALGSGTRQHIGICMNKGCTQVLSNSSSKASFSWKSDTDFGGYYGVPSKIYRVVK